MSEDKKDWLADPVRWNYNESKSMALLWLRSKNQMLMDIAQRMKPEDLSQPSEQMDLFIDLTGMYSAMDCAIDMVEEVQRQIWDAEAKNAELKLTIRHLSDKVRKYEEQFDELDEYLR